MSHRDATGLTACRELITVLESQLHTATQLRDQLKNEAISPAAVPAACEHLLQTSVEAARAAADLRDRLCEPLVNGRSTRGYTRER